MLIQEFRKEDLSGVQRQQKFQQVYGSLDELRSDAKAVHQDELLRLSFGELSATMLLVRRIHGVEVGAAQAVGDAGAGLDDNRRGDEGGHQMSAANGETLVSVINRLLLRLDARGVSANEIVACIKPLIAESEAKALSSLAMVTAESADRNISLRLERDQLRTEVERLREEVEELRTSPVVTHEWTPRCASGECGKCL